MRVWRRIGLLQQAAAISGGAKVSDANRDKGFKDKDTMIMITAGLRLL